MIDWTAKHDGEQIWVDLMKANLDNKHIPVAVEEEKPMSDDTQRQQDFYIHELQVEVANLTGTLFGREGNNGRLGNIEKAIEKQTSAINRLAKQYAEHISEHREHMRQIEKSIASHEAQDNTRFAKVEKDVNNLGDKMRDQAESVEILSKAASIKVTWWKQLGTHVLKILVAAAALAVVGGFSTWVITLL